LEASPRWRQQTRTARGGVRTGTDARPRYRNSCTPLHCRRAAARRIGHGGSSRSDAPRARVADGAGAPAARRPPLPPAARPIRVATAAARPQRQTGAKPTRGRVADAAATRHASASGGGGDPQPARPAAGTDTRPGGARAAHRRATRAGQRSVAPRMMADAEAKIQTRSLELTTDTARLRRQPTMDLRIPKFSTVLVADLVDAHTGAGGPRPRPAHCG